MSVRTVPQPLAFVAAIIAFLSVMAAAGAPSVLLSRDQQAWGFPDAALTVAFAIYALVLLGALVVCGSVSDRVGRRPVAVAALALNAIAMVQFLTADTIGELIAARAVQGAATGVVTTVFSAWIMELASPRGKRTAEVIVSITTAGGLGIGAVIAGAAAEGTNAPNTVVFGAALVVIVITGAILAASPETVLAVPRHRAPALPRVRIAENVSPRFIRLIPAIVGIWMSAGLILGLGASLAHTTLHLGDGFAAALVVALQPLTATVCTIVIAPRLPPRLLQSAGTTAVIVGVTAEGASFLTEAAPVLVLGAVITGLGFGAVFSGILRELLPSVRDDERAGFFASFYLVGYLAYGLSAIAAGLLSDSIGLRWAAVVYALATLAATTVSAVTMRLPRSPTRTSQGPLTITLGKDNRA